MSAPDVLFPATVAGMAPEVPDTSTGSPRRGPAGQDELYLDEILALTPLKRTRLYTLRDKGSFGPVREAPGPTCPRPVFRLDGVAAVCESLGYEAPTTDDLRTYRERAPEPAAEAAPQPSLPPPLPARPPAAVPEEAAHQERVRALEDERDEARRRLTALEVAFAEVEATRDRAVGDLQGRAEADAVREAELERLAAAIDAQRDDAGRLTAEAARHEERVRLLEADHEQLRDERDRARAEEITGRERAIGLEADLRIAEAGRERALEDVTVREARIRRLESDLEERTAEAHRQEAELRGTTTELHQATTSRDEARAERDDLRRDLGEAREENAALRPEVELLRANTTRGFRRRQRRQARQEAKAVSTPTGDADGSGEEQDGA